MEHIKKINTMRLIVFSAILSSSLLISCSPTQKTTVAKGNSQDKLLMAVSWYQHSAEMTALYYQGFNIARERLDEAIAAKKSGKPLAVVVDIDETMLDNSPFETAVIIADNTSPDWYNWTSKASAKALPGALDFAKYAQSRNVEIYYITNRDSSERAPTLKNLMSEGFPYAVADHLFTRNDLSFSNGNTSSKKGRRAKVAENHDIVLLIGDNLNDFSEIFEDRSSNNGKDAVAANREQFGNKFIILPNPMYGAWEKPLYNYQDKISEEQKTLLLKDKLEK